MKRMTALLLGLVFCLSLCACDKTGNNSASTESSVNPLKEAISDITWCLLGQYDPVPVATLKSGHLSEDGIICGSWDVVDDILTLTYFEDTLTGTLSQPQTYQIKEHGGIYFLIGTDMHYSSVSPAAIPVTEVEITLDNWQNYFEVATIKITKKKTDGAGNSVENTTEKQVLKLKPAFICRFNPNVTNLIVQTASTSNDQYMEYIAIPQRIEMLNGNIPVYRDWTYIFGLDTWEENEEIVRIQGSLAFIDGL